MTALRIGTRGSALALWQANYVRERIARIHGTVAELVRIRTTGDHFRSASVAQLTAQSGSKGVFIKEIEDALLEGTIDLAVHSMKDVPTEIPAGLAFPAIAKREDARDCLMSRGGRKLADLPSGARIGTSSLRRHAQLRHHRPDVIVCDLRGNVDTRMKKLDAGEFDAIVLAAAGVMRLGATDRIAEILPVSTMLPAVGQGALGIETRADDRATTELMRALDDTDTRSTVTAERALLRELEGGCQVPLGAFATLANGELHLVAGVFSSDGSDYVCREATGTASDPEALGKNLACVLIEAGAGQILRLAGRSIEQS
ncbi:MAG: hydroxymethylbilane synthase [Candidatus Acidiferrales bacterium]